MRDVITVYKQSGCQATNQTHTLNPRLLSNSHTHKNDIHVFLFIREQLGKVFVDIRVERLKVFRSRDLQDEVLQTSPFSGPPLCEGRGIPISSPPLYPLYTLHGRGGQNTVSKTKREVH